ncbi:MAG: helix-hairpin-helix domain-containing protein [Bacteroidota bacterium]
MNLKEITRDYLGFTRKERIGITVIIILFLIVFFFPLFTGYKKRKRKIETDSSWINAIRKLEQKNTDTGNRPVPEKSYPADDNYSYLYDHSTSKSTPATLFYFDPNTISHDTWKQLGVHEKVAATIQKYLSKGGTFRKAEDLQKVYGLSKEEYDRLAPYIKIENAINNYPGKGLPAEKKSSENIPGSSHYRVIEINTADTAAFISLPGIGSKLAMRIINFRDKLGGFYSTEQIKETYGIADSVFQKVKQYLGCENISLRKININTATKDELKSHPYIKWDIANAIVEYRNQHGLFSATGDLKKIQVINDEIFNRIIPYLVL